MSIRLTFSLKYLLLILLISCVPQTIQTPVITDVKSTLPQPSPTISPQPSPTPTIEISPTFSTVTEAPEVTEIPLLIQYGVDLNNRVVSVNPIDTNQMAYCSSGGINFSMDGGETWQAISTNPVSIAAQNIGYQDFSGENVPPTCYQAFQDPDRAQSFYAVFSTIKPEYGAPPLFYMGFLTTDSGATWQAVPPPENSTYEYFGGYWSDGSSRVQALFIETENLSDSPALPIVLETTDGGSTWSPGQLICPPVGMCLRWGAAASMIPGMGSPLPQPAYYSQDNGATWLALGSPVELRLPGPNQLISFSNNQGGRISGEIISATEGDAPYLFTEDNGQTWMERDLPPLPDATQAQNVYPGLQILPDGSLISQGAETSSWYLLPTGGSAWCSLETVELPSYPVQLAVSNGKVWWLTLETGELRSTNLEGLTCP